MFDIVHVQPITWTVRFYPNEGGFPGPFVGVVTIQAIGTHAVYMSGMSGKVTRKHLEELAKHFYALGYRKVFVQRHGKLKTVLIERYLKG